MTTTQTRQQVALYPDGETVHRGDSIVGGDGHLYDFVALSTAHPGNVIVRGMEQACIPARWFGLTVGEETPEPCPSTITLGPRHDPTGADCSLPRGHFGVHSSPDPWDRPEPLTWTGGGSCAGDPLPHRIVKA